MLKYKGIKSLINHNPNPLSSLHISQNKIPFLTPSRSNIIRAQFVTYSVASTSISSILERTTGTRSRIVTADKSSVTDSTKFTLRLISHLTSSRHVTAIQIYIFIFFCSVALVSVCGLQTHGVSGLVLFAPTVTVGVAVVQRNAIRLQRHDWLRRSRDVPG
ncbi:hypothetical protein JTE90_009903 [Oedothorax gibbosus]|uniref:Transmembrane protein n=1 Tax=Oedothorax gibbosus TaxID=931172 RepID=A0AAV6UV79_9ARAC|nr:hypothetical protein JTE90_009903 [Oedothorax gibbosus]